MLLITNRDFLQVVEKCRSHLLLMNLEYKDDWYCGNNISNLLQRSLNEEFNLLYLYDLQDLQNDTRNTDISAPYIYLNLEKICLERNKVTLREYMNNRAMY